MDQEGDRASGRKVGNWDPAPEAAPADSMGGRGRDCRCLPSWHVIHTHKLVGTRTNLPFNSVYHNLLKLPHILYISTCSTWDMNTDA